MEETKVRSITPKSFLRKCNSKAAMSAIGFLANEENRKYLLEGEAASVTAPIVNMFDAKEILPTPAMDAIRTAIFGYMVAVDLRDANESVAKREGEVDSIPSEKKEPSVKRIPKAWTVTIYDSRGNVQVHVNKETGEETDLVKGFDLSQRATEWADRRLFECSSDCFGVVKSNTLITKDGDALSQTIIREDSISRIMKQPKGAVCKHKPKSGSRLSFGVKVTNDRAIFSGG